MDHDRAAANVRRFAAMPRDGWAALFASAFRQSKNPMVLVDDERRIVETNTAFLRLLGRRRCSGTAWSPPRRSTRDSWILAPPGDHGDASHEPHPRCGRRDPTMSSPLELRGLVAPEGQPRPADAFMREIADSIVSGRYAADEVLPPEAVLGAYFHTSDCWSFSWLTGPPPEAWYSPTQFVESAAVVA